MVNGTELLALLNRDRDQCALLFGLFGLNNLAEYIGLATNAMVEIPADMFAGNFYPHHLTIKVMELLQVIINDLADGCIIGIGLKIARL